MKIFSVNSSTTLLHLNNNNVSIFKMNLTKDVHRQFAQYFNKPSLEPYLYLLSKRLSEGHICIDLETLSPDDWEEIGYSQPAENALQEPYFVSDGTARTPLVLWNKNLYLQRYFHYEEKVFENLKLFISHNEELEIKNKLIAQKTYVQKLFSASSEIDWQMIAGLSAVLNRFTIITGGPGTGKTTTVAKFLSLLLRLNSDLRVALAAPTGKAAARMAESLKNSTALDEESKKIIQQFEPSTIHRLLKVNRNSIHFKHNKENPIPYDLVIIDESSMIDIALFSKLMDAIPNTAKIVLLGDKNQLASVEAGSLFGDLCLAQNQLNLFSKERAQFINQFIDADAAKISSEYITDKNHLLFEKVIELQKSYRFSDDGGIGKLSKAIISNNRKNVISFFENTDKEVEIDTEYSEENFKDFIKGYEDYIRETDIQKAFEKLNQLRVLCAVREGPQGIYAVNSQVENYLIEKNLISRTGEFYENRPIIITGNNYELSLFNGDIGIVRSDENGKLRVWFEDENNELKSVLPAYITAAETVFAMTIHKSQGSEFEKVFVILPDLEDNPLLSRELLYTAVTRAKKEVIVQSRKDLFLKCIERGVERSSGFAKRFNNV